MITLKELQNEIPYIVTKETGILQVGFHVKFFDETLTCKELPGWSLRYYKDPTKFDKIYQRARFELDQESLNNHIKFHKLKIEYYEHFKV